MKRSAGAESESERLSFAKVVGDEALDGVLIAVLLSQSTMFTVYTLGFVPTVGQTGRNGRIE
jgi:hypothetical protein